MNENLIRFMVPALGILLAFGLARLIIKKEYPVQKWHGNIGIVISVGVIFLSIYMQKTPYSIPLLIIGGILTIFFMAILFAVGKRDKGQEEHNKSE